ncbi:hypothetical protein [Kitasatospora sp. NPDC056181]|uniref:hypothetical protein n=1 Tax=Kitasatospora sp. NPDC056181 TaxID=3345737 RepID=UPI0035D82147
MTCPQALTHMCWSPIVRCNLACPQCLDDKIVRETTAAERLALAAHIAASGILGVDASVQRRQHQGIHGPVLGGPLSS